MPSLLSVIGSSNELRKKPLRLVLLNIVLAGLYFLLAFFSLKMALPNSVASPFWPPSGLAIAAVLCFGPAALPAIFVGALAANFLSGVSGWVAPVVGSF